MIEQHDDFEIAAPHPLSVVCFRYRGSDDDNRWLMDAVNATGRTFLSHTVLNGRFVIRLAIGNIAVTREDVMLVWQMIKEQVALLKQRPAARQAPASAPQ